jgi:hypothetical protein
MDEDLAPSKRPIPDDTRHSQETDSHAQGLIRTRNPNKLAIAGPLFLPRYHLDSQVILCCKKLSLCNVLVEFSPGNVIEFLGFGFVPQKRLTGVRRSNSPKLFSDEILSSHDNPERRQMAGLIVSKMVRSPFWVVKNFIVFFLLCRNNKP